MKQKGIPDETIRMVTHQNAITAFGQSGQINEVDFAAVKNFDQSQMFAGSTVLRGGQAPRVDKDSLIIR